MIVFYISGHGFGHASRDIEVLNALGRLAPHVPVAVRTSAPKWLFDLTLDATRRLPRRASATPASCRSTASSLDEARHDRAARRVSRGFEALAGRRGAVAPARSARDWWSRDIPPLAFAAARAAGLPSIALGNFTWDWIYEGYRDWLAAGLRSASSGSATRTRWPMSRCACRCTAASRRWRRWSTCRSSRGDRRGPADDARATGLPPIARSCCCRSAATACSASTWTPSAGLEPLHDRRDGRRHREPARNEVPSGAGGAPLPPTCSWSTSRHSTRDGLRYEDLVAAVDVVITKPGYGIIAECVANDTALVYTSRGHFVEYDVLVREMPRWLRCGFISNDALLAGAGSRRWTTCWLSRRRPRRSPSTARSAPPGRIADLACRGRRQVVVANAASVLDARDQRPDRRDIHLLDRHRGQLGLCEERRQVEIRLEADVDRERAKSRARWPKGRCRCCGND